MQQIPCLSDHRLVFLTTDEQLDAAYSDVKSVISIGRGIGYWGDMVVELRNGDKIEMRALPRCALWCVTQQEQDQDYQAVEPDR